MTEILISHMETDLDPDPLDLRKFAAESHSSVRAQIMQWARGWGELLPIALFSQGPDLSQIGSTWLGSLQSMNALRPFKLPELEAIGAPQAFLPNIWNTTVLQGSPLVYAIPFTADTRILLYRRDMLARAGVDEETAFLTTDHLYETLERLQAAGVEIPWAVSTVDEIHHFSAPWIWQAGGDFHTAKDAHLSLVDPRTIEGIYQFYRLHRFIPPQAQGLSVSDCDALFRNGRAAVVYTIHNTLNTIIQHKTSAVSIENIRAAKVPGIPFVGASHLVIWKHSLAETASIELIRFLTSAAYQSDHQRRVGDLPVLTEVLSQEPYKSDPNYKVSAESLLTGRTIQTVPHWAAVEMRIVTMMQQLWLAVFADPGLDLRQEIRRRVAEVSKNLERTILLE